MNGNEQINAIFQDRFSLIINNQLVIGSSVNFPEGTVNISPAPGSDDKYASGTQLTITASPNAGYGWKLWSGTSSDGSNPSKITITSDKHVAVTFELRFYLTLNGQSVTGPSFTATGGTVSISPAPGTDGRYSTGTTIVLTSTPSQEYRFGSWAGDVTGTTSSVTAMMSANKSINVSFIRTYLLVASVSPANGGSVTPSGGIYDENSNVSLTAMPATGYRFDHWSGDASGTANPVTVNMNAAKNIVANFVKTYTLTEQVNPVGSGTVAPCGCAYDANSSLTLTATPASGYRFDHWSGDVSGNVSTVNITLDGDKTVTANFVKTSVLNVSVSPNNGGSVTPSGGTFDAGTAITLTASPATGFHFDHWSGDVSGNTTSISITMTGDKSVTAVFAP